MFLVSWIPPIAVKESGLAFLTTSMSEKPFADMSLEEVFDVEQKHSANLGRTVASADGLKRRKAAMQATLKSEARQLKRRKATTSR